jgi:hypothetical protein
MKPLHANACRTQRGATLAEFVVIGPLAFVLILAIVQLGFIFMARSTLNQAAFMAAREGAIHNADLSVIRGTLIKGLIPFYQDSTNTDNFSRLSAAYLKAQADMLLPYRLDVQILNPTPASFKDFGIPDPNDRSKQFIPNDNLQFRTKTIGKESAQTLMDANLLRIRVTYAYEMKVPLIAHVFQRVMCGSTGGGGISAFGDNTPLWEMGAPVGRCPYYVQGRIPIVSYATVRMQSPSIAQK